MSVSPMNAERRDAAAGLAQESPPPSPLRACWHNSWDKDKWWRSRQFRGLLFRGSFPWNLLAEIFCILRIADSLAVRSIGRVVSNSICRQQPRVAGWAEDSNFSDREIWIPRGRCPYQHDIATGGFLEIDRDSTTSIIIAGADRPKCGEGRWIDPQARPGISGVIARQGTKQIKCHRGRAGSRES